MGLFYNIKKIFLACLQILEESQNNQQQQQGKPNKPQNQNQYPPEPSFPPPTQPLDKAFNELWRLDARDRLVVGKDIIIHLQNATKVFQENDKCDGPLFDRSTNLKKLSKNVPTMSRFMDLLDNYKSEAGVAESIGQKEILEQQAFINECLKQPTIQFAFKYLSSSSPKFRATFPNCNTIEDFGKVIGTVWFSLYKRVVQNDSSAFEHTFVGETSKEKNQVSGMHNWIMVCSEEKAGRVDYQGYIKRRNDPTNFQVLSFQIRWKGLVKPVSTFFMGSSPHFEIALYTLIFLASDNEDNYVSVPGVTEPINLNIKCHRFRNRQGQQLGTIYPEVRKANAHM